MALQTLHVAGTALWFSPPHGDPGQTFSITARFCLRDTAGNWVEVHGSLVVESGGSGAWYGLGLARERCANSWSISSLESLWKRPRARREGPCTGCTQTLASSSDSNQHMQELSMSTQRCLKEDTPRLQLCPATTSSHCPPEHDP